MDLDFNKRFFSCKRKLLLLLFKSYICVVRPKINSFLWDWCVIPSIKQKIKYIISSLSHIIYCVLSGGDTRTTHLPQKEYTFEVFMCAAILMEFRNDLFKCTDTGMVFTCVNR